MLEVSKIQEHAKRKPQKLYPRVKKGSELWGDHKQIWILLPFPNPLLIKNTFFMIWGRCNSVFPAFSLSFPGLSGAE